MIASSPAPLRFAQVTTSDMSVRLLLASQIQALAEHGFSVTAVCAPGKWLDEIRAMGITVTEVRMERELAPARDLRSLFDLVRCFRRGRFTIVDTHTPKAGLLGPLAARIARVPIIIHTVHGLLFHDRMPRSRQRFFRGIERITAKCAHYLFFQSSEDLETAARLGFRRRDRLFYIGNGIDLRRFDPAATTISRDEVRRGLGMTDDEFIVGIVARLTYEKGLREFFAAALLLLEHDSRFRFLVIGPVESDQNDSVKPHEIQEVEATGRFTFLGMRRDIRDLYTAMDVFVLPSYREGIPRALMEACAMEVPVVATDIRGCREVVDNGVTGYLVPVRDVASLAEAVIRLSDDPERSRAMGRAARLRIQNHFDERIVNQRILSAVETILKSRDQ